MSDDMPLHFSSNSSNQSDHSLPTKIAKLEARMIGKASSAATVASSGGSGAANVAIAAPSPALQQQQQQPPLQPQQQQQPPPPPPPPPQQQQQPAWSPVVSSSDAKFVADELAEPSTSSDSDDDEIVSHIRSRSQSITSKEQSSRPSPLAMCMNIMKEMGFSVKHQMIMWHYFAAHPQVQRTFCQLSDDDRRGIIASVVKSQSPAAD